MIYRIVAPEAGEILVSPKTGSVSLAYNGNPIDYFDRDGRLLGSQVGDRHYRRGLDNRLLEKYRRPEEGEHVRNEVPEPARQRLITAAYERAGMLADAVSRSSIECRPTHPSDMALPLSAREALAGFLNPILAQGFERLCVEAMEFQRMYAPVSILPPDQYLSVVAQLTTGCSYNRCTFCNFYKSRGFTVKSADEFRRHLSEVVSFPATFARLRKSVFLADGNALSLPHTKLLEMFGVLHEFFSFVPSQVCEIRERYAYRKSHPHSYEGVFSFVDGRAAMEKTVDDFRELKEQHLRRVYVGLESGDDALLTFVRKPATRSEIIDAVRRMKTAGLNVGVIAMVGVGGDRFAATHVEETINAINAMELGDGDIIYLSDFVNHRGLPYERLARERGIRDLTSLELKTQRNGIRAGLRWKDPGKPAQVSLYDIREFIY